MSSVSSAVPTSSYGSGSNSNPSSNSQGNPNPDPFSTSPSVYLYGFLATLILIFLISLFVAYRGYRTRRMLRQRIEEALARGVNLTAYADGTNPRGRRIPIGEKPTLLDVWIQSGDVPAKFAAAGGQSGHLPLYADWDSLKPIALTSTQRRPIAEDAMTPNPPLVRPIPPRFPRSLIEAFRDYWLPGESATPSSRAAMPAGWNASPSPAPRASVTNANEAPSSQSTKAMHIVDALEKARLGVFIAMPNPASSQRFNPHSSRRMANRQSVASTSTLGPSLAMSHNGPEELPELVIGTADVGLPLPEAPSPGNKTPDLQRETTAEASGTHGITEVAPRSSLTTQRAESS